MTGTDPSRGGRWPLAGYAERILLSLSLGWFAIVTGRLLIPPLLPFMRADLGLTLATAGVMLTMFEATSALMFFPAGRVSDHLGRAMVVVPGLGVFAVGLVLIAGAPFYLALLAGAATMGVGNGLFTISARALISDTFTERRGRALGVFAAGFNVGGILASGVAILALAQWRLPFAAAAAVLVAVGLLFLHWNREPFALERLELGVRATARRLAATRELRRPILAYALFFVVTQSFLGFFPTFLNEVKGLSPTMASGGFALVFLVGIAAKVSAGSLSDRFSSHRVALVGIALAAVGIGWLVLAEGLLALGLATVVFAVGHQAQFPLIDAILMDAVPAESLGGDIGAARTAFQLVGALGPTYVGVVALQFGLTAAFVGLIVALVAMGLLFVPGSR